MGLAESPGHRRTKPPEVLGGGMHFVFKNALSSKTKPELPEVFGTALQQCSRGPGAWKWK